MFQLDKNVTAENVRYFQPAGLNGRWVFAGSRNAGGYATREDAMIEAKLQLSNHYSGSLNTAKVTAAANRASVSALEPLWNKGLAS